MRPLYSESAKWKSHLRIGAQPALPFDDHHAFLFFLFSGDSHTIDQKPDSGYVIYSKKYIDIFLGVYTAIIALSDFLYP